MVTQDKEAPQELIDVKRVSELLGCTPRMVRKLASEHTIPVVKVGSLTRFRPGDIDAYIESRTVKGAAE